MYKTLFLLGIMVLGISSHPQTVQESTTETEEYLVAVDFIIEKSYKSEHYKALKVKFIEAATEWSRHLPVRMRFFTKEQVGGKIPIGMVQFKIGPQPKSFSKKGNLNGYFNHSTLTIYICDHISDEQCYFTSLHELGHLFGLPHIVNYWDNNFAVTGDIFLNPKSKAEHGIMYPYSNLRSLKSHSPSKLEIRLARKYVLNEIRQKRFSEKTCYHR